MADDRQPPRGVLVQFLLSHKGLLLIRDPKGKAHQYDHLGYAGRRVLVSRKWSGKMLADHRGDRRAWLTEMLGLPATDPSCYRWEQVGPDDDDYLPSGRRLLRSVADRLQWENALTEARRRAQEALAAELSATGKAA